MPHIPIQIPKQSIATHEATLIEYLIEEDDWVYEEEPLFLIETDKVATEIYAAASGVVHWTAAAGQTYDVGTPIGYIDTEGA